MLFGAALCGISAGVFWMAEAAIAIAYPEPWNKGKALGYWLTYRLSGQILGGAINLGINAENNQAGKVSYTVFIVFIAIQAAGPFVALFLNKPADVEREDGKKVNLSIVEHPWYEIKATTRNLLKPKFLLIVLFIGQVVFSEAVFFTYLASKFQLQPSTVQWLTGMSVVHCPGPGFGILPLRNRRSDFGQRPGRKLKSHIPAASSARTDGFQALARPVESVAQDALPEHFLDPGHPPGRVVDVGDGARSPVPAHQTNV